tara:strand:- start:341 stop:646 length:306 start_codon:yes stop_codon:yes gene_type:complete
MEQEEQPLSTYHRFLNEDELFLFLESHQLFTIDRGIRDFSEAYLHINKGCSCSKKKRVQRVKDIYTQFHKIVSDGAKMRMKLSTGTNRIQLYYNGGLFAEW